MSKKDKDKYKDRRRPKREQYIITPPIVGVTGTFRDRDYGHIVTGKIIDRHTLEDRRGNITNAYITVDTPIGNMRICCDPAPIPVPQGDKPKAKWSDESDWADYMPDMSDHSRRQSKY